MLVMEKLFGTATKMTLPYVLYNAAICVSLRYTILKTFAHIDICKKNWIGLGAYGMLWPAWV